LLSHRDHRRQQRRDSADPRKYSRMGTRKVQQEEHPAKPVTPTAATIVAACINGLTGVGPSSRPGSHTCSGNWGRLPHRATKIINPATRGPPIQPVSTPASP